MIMKIFQDVILNVCQNDAVKIDCSLFFHKYSSIHSFFKSTQLTLSLTVNLAGLLPFPYKTVKESKLF